MDASKIDPIPDLLTPPVQRAAYSDRKAWLMAVMSQLAYLPFEGKPDHESLRSIAQSISGNKDLGSVVSQLQKLVTAAQTGDDGYKTLETKLGELGLEIVKTFSVNIPLSSDSQAFIARVSLHTRNEGRPDFLVVSFRGTEPTKMADIRTDLRAELIGVESLPDRPAKVHQGFHEALYKAPPGQLSIVKQISNVLLQDEHKNLPVFVTGHSLGGGLAVIATRYIANGSRGACYTFGQPRVSNQHFNDQIFTPVYRVVNAADIVPAVPMGEVFMNLTIDILSFLTFPGKKLLIRLLQKIEGYRHGGDQRFLSPARSVSSDDPTKRYPDLDVYSNPSLFDRWVRSGHRIFASWGGTFLGDHDIRVYVDKLACYGLRRINDRNTLNQEMQKHVDEVTGEATDTGSDTSPNVPPSPPTDTPPSKPSTAAAATPKKRTTTHSKAKPKSPAKPKKDDDQA